MKNVVEKYLEELKKAVEEKYGCEYVEDSELPDDEPSLRVVIEDVDKNEVEEDEFKNTIEEEADEEDVDGNIDENKG